MGNPVGPFSTASHDKRETVTFIGGNISTVGILEHPQILFDKIQFVRCADHEPSQVIDLQIANEPRHSRN